LAGCQREPNAYLLRARTPYRDLVKACPLTEKACVYLDRDSKPPVFYGISVHESRTWSTYAKPRLCIHNKYSRRRFMTDNIFRRLHPLLLACSAPLGAHGTQVSASVQGGNFGRYS